MNEQVKANLSALYLEPLLAGNRQGCRDIIDKALQGGLTARELLIDLIWPTMEHVRELFRDDRISQAGINLATRLNRMITDQLVARLDRSEPNGRKALIFCGNDEPEELGGQLCADLFEADGWEVRFAGGGVPDDEVLKLIGTERPDLLCLFATLPTQMPAVRKLIDYLRQVNSCPDMQVLCCGGIYKRAEGLAEEIGADLFAPDAHQAVRAARENPSRRATVDQQTVGRARRVRRADSRRKDPVIHRIAPQIDAA
jgi:methanogenic corrinoid protein MtbC1